jgi:hypothetical protein
MTTNIANFTLLGGGVVLAALAGVVPGIGSSTELQAAMQVADTDNARRVFAIDVAVDCRTAVSGPNRGDVFTYSGKAFPFGTLPSGAASFDPTQPVNGISPVGDWHLRGQHASPLPPALAPFYPATPFDFATAYIILDGGRTALISEAYNFLPSGIYFASVTGGIGRFRGAAGDYTGAPIGTNATGCPNFHTRINFLPGSIRGASDN